MSYHVTLFLPPAVAQAHFQVDDSGLLSLSGVEALFEKTVTVEEDKEESTLSKLGSTISKLFSGSEGEEEEKKEGEEAEGKEETKSEDKEDESDKKKDETKEEKKDAKKDAKMLDRNCANRPWDPFGQIKPTFWSQKHLHRPSRTSF